MMMIVTMEIFVVPMAVERPAIPQQAIVFNQVLQRLRLIIFVHMYTYMYIEILQYDEPHECLIVPSGPMCSVGGSLGDERFYFDGEGDEERCIPGNLLLCEYPFSSWDECAKTCFSEVYKLVYNILIGTVYLLIF